jgi:flavin-dependent dehydrogenase
MERFDVLIIGGGPAGSTCACQLVRAGARIAIVDRARFPRDKVCTGWITPAVVTALDLDLTDYGKTRTLQSFRGFETATLDGPLRATQFDDVVGYGIRRVEFDAYLLGRSGATVIDGESCRTLRRAGSTWVVNDRLSAPVVVGAGGNFCPVARRLNPTESGAHVIVAQEVEFPLGSGAAGRCAVKGEQPMLFFWPDLLGYGWCVRKGDYLNVGVGRLGADKGFPAEVHAFRARLVERGLLAGAVPDHWKGHAYRLSTGRRACVAGDGLYLVGDAAGLALAPSGEGILSAVESGSMAAGAIASARGDRTEAPAAAYAASLDARFGARRDRTWLERLPESVREAAGLLLLHLPFLTRRLLLEDGFLHARRPILHRTAEISPA